MTQCIYAEIRIKDHIPIAFNGTLSHAFQSASRFPASEVVSDFVVLILVL